MQWQLGEPMGQRYQFPSFLGIGTQKGGTTTLQHLLAQHPQVFLPAAKELQFFSLHYGRGVAWYAEQFSAAGSHQCCGEITPYYLFHPMAPQRIAGLLPRVKLVVLLRDPVERCLSQYFHSCRLGLELLPLEAALAAEPERLQYAELALASDNGRHRSHQEHSYVARSRYERQLVGFQQYFRREQLLILRSEDLFSAPQRVWLQVLAFLQLSPCDLPEFSRANAGGGEAEAVAPLVRQRLRAELEPTYQAMAEIYGLQWP